MESVFNHGIVHGLDEGRFLDDDSVKFRVPNTKFMWCDTKQNLAKKMIYIVWKLFIYVFGEMKFFEFDWDFSVLIYGRKRLGLELLDKTGLDDQEYQNTSAFIGKARQ